MYWLPRRSSGPHSPQPTPSLAESFLPFPPPFPPARPRPAAENTEATLPAAAENWPGFRGPSRQGVSSADSLPLKWDGLGDALWQTEIPGEGHSSPIVWGDRIFLTTATNEGASAEVLCLDAPSGRILWRTKVFDQETARKESRNSYATPTPVTDGQRVYAVFGSGGIAALDFDGKIEWTFREFRFYSRHGLGASPLLEDGLLVMPWDWSTDPDKEGADKERVGWQVPWDRSFVFALHADSGKLAWKTMRGTSRIAHITPHLWKDPSGRKTVISPAGDVVQAFDLASGEKLWSAANPGEGVSPSLIIAENLAIQPNGFQGAESVRAFRLNEAKGEVAESTMAWEQDKNPPKLPSMIYSHPHVFAITEGGMAWCATAATGEVLWRERIGGTFAASPILNQNRIFITAENGSTTVLSASPKFEILAENPLDLPVQASPAIYQNSFLIRSASHLTRIGSK
jgi:outer membrane protein assembly factor BamB